MRPNSRAVGPERKRDATDSAPPSPPPSFGRSLKGDDAEPTQERKPIAAVERAAQVLAAFREGDRTLSLAELNFRTGLHKSTIIRLARTLESLGFLDRSKSGEYRIGQEALRLGALYQNSILPSDLIMPALNELVDETGESASYFVRRGELRVCIYRVQSKWLLGDHSQVGDVIPLDRGAAGKMFRAFESNGGKQYARIRGLMIASSVGDIEDGMAGLASPVLGRSGRLEGVLTLTGTERRFRRATNYISSLIETARRVTMALGGQTDLFDSRIHKARAVKAVPTSIGQATMRQRQIGTNLT